MGPSITPGARGLFKNIVGVVIWAWGIVEGFDAIGGSATALRSAQSLLSTPQGAAPASPHAMIASELCGCSLIRG